MDTGEGRFEMLNSDMFNEKTKKQPNRKDIFSVGEIVMIKESKFRIKKITSKKMTLRLLPK